MATLTEKIKAVAKAFIEAVSNSKTAVVGCIITIVLLPVLFISILLDLVGFANNPYFGFLIYMVMGPLWTIGIILIGIGLATSRGGERIGVYALEYLQEQFSLPGRFRRVRKLLLLVSVLSVVSIVLVVTGSYTAFRYTETVAFCATFCHQVMEPEFVTYQHSPHSQIPCVRCHIGQEAGLLTKSKISGLKQLAAVATNTYSRPIPTPVSGLRPSREVCEQCHRPEMFHGDKLYTRRTFQQDRTNTELQTVMLMRVGAGGYRGQAAYGIHWHISPDHTVFYTYTDRERRIINRVRVVNRDGTERVFSRAGQTSPPGRNKEAPSAMTRSMDCIDCHNRPAHIFLGPSEAIDNRLASGHIAASIPFIKQRAVQAITREFASLEDARVGISRQLRDWYDEHFPEYRGAQKKILEQAIQAVYQAYAENVFPAMGVGWNTYENMAGHRNDSGCFRCHNRNLVDQEGKSISQDCTICHVIVADNEEPREISTLFKR